MATDQRTRHVTTKPSPTILYVLYGVIALLVLGVGYLLYRNTVLSNEFERERSEIRETVRKNQLANDRQQLQFSMKTFVWAVRNALLQNKAGEINEYFNTLVKDRGIKEMLLVDPAGQVTISTNKKNQGISFASRFPTDLLGQDDVYFKDGVPYELSAPVTSPNERLGTLVMFYKPAPILPDSLSSQ
ncbi:hypothetical protein [Spirosoma rhododendri]|uniref:Uncharacterized protein n=1 Tax=Spirosoma rhododendri TaxID=2728024 RepID=A0A7L5E1L1_9BACT|nr:hypothetical protein [Spirosoma rhododendri]QJD81600.1 hypothetical protein HH216_24930 [Spirosoma rhododendri]